jgi:crossover junction endodeoxyribonuclease RuvC
MMTARRRFRDDDPDISTCGVDVVGTIEAPRSVNQRWRGVHIWPAGGYRIINGGMGRPIRILGIDPGLRRTGWGVVAVDGNRLGFVACGSVSTDDRLALAERLVEIHGGLQQIIERHAPDEAAVEATFVNRDANATLKLGQARGVAMLVPAMCGLPVAEYAPNLVKKTIVGTGHGEKTQIRMMIGVLLPKADPQSEDAADALAIAVTHAHHRQSVILKVAAR